MSWRRSLIAFMGAGLVAGLTACASEPASDATDSSDLATTSSASSRGGDSQEQGADAAETTADPSGGTGDSSDDDAATNGDDDADAGAANVDGMTGPPTDMLMDMCSIISAEEIMAVLDLDLSQGEDPWASDDLDAGSLLTCNWVAQGDPDQYGVSLLSDTGIMDVDAFYEGARSDADSGGIAMEDLDVPNASVAFGGEIDGAGTVAFAVDGQVFQILLYSADSDDLVADAHAVAVAVGQKLG